MFKSILYGFGATIGTFLGIAAIGYVKEQVEKRNEEHNENDPNQCDYCNKSHN